ncbi:MAG: TetR/AcrR family transcriptional regulator [Cyanobacteria bacterium SID2]|nr:TetR/AcrR family transcriptional regulator [Cyanobacteria bacterium SID2]MBP0005189.1 TetR/AcrR family transcriptional regulator [Cyanobacteria bacterium SBC]
MIESLGFFGDAAVVSQSTQGSKSRRSIRDAEKTKQHILDAAEIEFAKHGLKGARTDRISKTAGVASRMIYYYFESKEGLYQTVLQRSATGIQNAIASIDLENVSPDRALAEVIRAAIIYEMQYRHRGMLLFQEANQNQGKYFTNMNWQPAIDLLTNILDRGVKTQVFRPLDSYMTTLNIIGVCVFYGNAHENLKHITPKKNLLSEESIEQYVRSTIELVLNGVKNSLI